MKLIIDTRNGIAGDITCAGLIALGANPITVVEAMEFAGNRIGSAQIVPVFLKGNVSLDVQLNPHQDQLTETHAKEHLRTIMDELNFKSHLFQMGESILKTLCQAEKHVHSTDPRLKHMLKGHHHHLRHHTDRADKLEAILHETQDILCDITGFLIGIRELHVDQILYREYVNVGSGTIRFSHGTFPVPAPATKYILDMHHIPWLTSPDYSLEMTTPTGASILAGSNAEKLIDITRFTVVKQTAASGTRLGLPPVPFYLGE